MNINHMKVMLDLESFDERIERLCLRFVKKCREREKMENLFPLNQKTHPMLTRFNEMYQVNNADTGTKHEH